MISIRLYGAEAALLLFESFAFGTARGADLPSLVIAQRGFAHNAPAIGTFFPAGRMGSPIDFVTRGTPIAPAVAQALFPAQILAALAADFDDDGGFFHKCVAAGLPIGAEIGAAVGFACKAGAWTPLLGAFSAKDSPTFWTNQIGRHGYTALTLGLNLL